MFVFYISFSSMLSVKDGKWEKITAGPPSPLDGKQKAPTFFLSPHPSHFQIFTPSGLYVLKHFAL